MERPVVFITYFQSSFQTVHGYQVLRSEYFFQKFYDRFNIISIFFKFDNFYEKTYDKTFQFYDLFSNFLSLCARSENFVVWKSLLKKSRLFQNVNNLLFISTTLTNICNKTYEKTYHCSICDMFNIWTKSCLFHQLWTIFSTKIMKNPSIFVPYFSSLFQFSHCHPVLLWPHF